MTNDSVFRLLAISDEPEEAEHLTSLLRSAGYAVRTERAETDEEFDAALDRQRFDVVVHMLNALDLALSDTARILSKKGRMTPLIAAGEGDQDWNAADAMQAGATDRATPGNSEHLRRILIREFNNVRARRRAAELEEAYRESEQRARALMETSRDAIAYIHAGMHVLANDAYLERFGYNSFEELEGTPMMDMVNSDDQAKLKKFLRSFTHTEDVVGELQLQLRKANGDPFQAEMEFSRASIEGEPCSQIIIRDSGNTEELERQISRLTQSESLTGLYNRQYFMQLLAQTLETANHSHENAVLALLQVDDFDELRSQLGVLEADRVIASVAEVVSAEAGDHDILARLEGATYAMLCRNANQHSCERIVDAIQKRIKDSIFEIGNNSISATVSAGLALIDGGTSDANEIHARAEKALREASKSSPNTRQVYRPKAGEMSQREIDESWRAEIEAIISEERLRLLYQPIVSLSGDTTPRYEARVDAIDRDRNRIDTGAMFAAADRLDMAGKLDRHILLTAFRHLVQARSTDLQPIFFIPVSSSSFNDSALLRWIRDQLKELKLEPWALAFEADAETAAVRLKHAGAFASAVRRLGCSMVLRNFGRGSEPFQVLRHVEVDCLRISDALLEEIAGNPQSQEAVQQITNEARKHGKETICPGVADVGSLSVIWSLGSDLIQGDFLQPPTAELSYDFSELTM